MTNKRVIQERDGDNNPLDSFTRGSDLSGSMEGAGGIGGLLSRADGYNSGTGAWATNDYYFADGNGNIVYLTDSSQGFAAQYRYDPFGHTIGYSGPLAYDNSYRFSSKEILGKNLEWYGALYNFGYRFYDPNWQRWLTQDPADDVGFETATHALSEAGTSVNPYIFVENCPVDKNDFLGLCNCAQLKKDLRGFEAAADDLQRMYFHWKPGQTWKDYNLAPVANAAGFRGSGFGKLDKCTQEIVNDLEHNWAITGMNAAQLAIIGGVGYYTLGLHGLIHGTSAQEQWWLTHIVIERFRTQVVISRLKKLIDCCAPKESMMKKHLVP